MPGGQMNQTTPSRKERILGIILLIIISVSAGFAGGYYGSKKGNNLSGNNTKTTQQIVSNESELISKIVKEVGPSVVSINVIGQSADADFFGMGPGQLEGAGTGVILNSEGVVMTNRHVVPAGTTNVSVTLSDGTQLTDVEVIGRTNSGDPLDVAFLKIKDKKGKTLVPAKLGDSAKMRVGDAAIAIGNALGQFQNTVTTGIISGYGRSVVAGDGNSFSGSAESLQNLFQTDAAINAGNSGGPLVNINSEVIGINTAVAGDGAENIGFAIPINDIKGLINSVLSKGKLERPYLGVRYVSLTDDIAYQHNLQTKRGAYIVPGSNSRATIIPDSPAAKAGLKEKDIIVKVNDTTIDENHSLTSVLGQYQVGDTVTLTIVRDGKEQTVQVILEPAPSS